MRAVLLTGYGGVEQLVYREDVAVPRPGAQDVLLRVGACGINNTDINLRTRWYDRTVNAALTEQMGLRGIGDAPEAAASWNEEAVSFPRIQGAAVAGRIVAVGDPASSTRLGERVIVDPQIRDASLPARAQLVAYLGADCDGGFAEFVVVPAQNAIRVETRLSDVELATFPTSYDTAEEMLERTRLASGETILVTGAAGGVGTALIQLSRIRGARIIAVAGQAKEDRIRALGAHDFIARERTDMAAAIRAAAGEQAVDVAADVVGGAVFGDLIKALGRGGRYVSAGAIAGPVQPFDLRDLIYKDLEMHGVTCPTRETFQRLVGYIEAGKLLPLVDRTFRLDELQSAQAEFVKRRHVGKLVVVP
jgi:NADPH:quinone reductase-like Zn-dependent oxidoreductase